MLRSEKKKSRVENVVLWPADLLLAPVEGSGSDRVFRRIGAFERICEEDAEEARAAFEGIQGQTIVIR